jgi:hypothetical protein
MSLETEVEARLGQALVAFGQGSGAIRVGREMVLALRERYESRLRKQIEQKPEEVAAQFDGLLDIVRTMGRLSADLATAAGQVTIDQRTFEKAAQIVEEAVRRGGGRDFPTPYCGAAGGPSPR